MKSSIEISYYPLDQDYKDIIRRFINKIMKYDDIDIQVNGFSTQLFGEYDRLMEIVTVEMKEAAQSRKGMFVMKVTGSDLQGPVKLNV